MSRSPGNYSMNLESVRGLQESLSDAVAGMQQHLATMTQQLDALQSDWAGEAFEAYAHAQRDWAASMRRLSVLLDDAARLAGAGVDHHLDARREVVALWQ
ncbi:WXG100 family type VII secretion target [uncultured Microbacterium sp.]|uniref:WXG100 family type VII secretion target n=1 Tax=uncultured Microbacterium sp. TaxID=191216 RepID=UPI0025E78176|nr:WXG100 family type VII secretion target [uncultured Microbacterium sp.]